jgi:hypothetical protein
MPRTVLQSQTPTPGGLNTVYTAVDNTNGMAFRNSGRGTLIVKATGALTITIPTPGAPDGLALADRTIVLATGNERTIRLDNESLYRQADGYTYLDFSAAAGTIALIS